MSTKRTLDAFFAAPKPKKRQKQSGLYKQDSKGVIDLDRSPSPSSSRLPSTKVEDEPIVILSDEEGDVQPAQTPEPSKDKPTVFLSSTGFAITAPDRDESPSAAPSDHPAYPFSIPALPRYLCDNLKPNKEPRVINDGIDLDLLCYEPYMSANLARDYGEFLRRELPFYRVQYKINRFGKETEINTPRYTVSRRSFVRFHLPTTHRLISQTVFGIDDTSRFSPEGVILDARTSKPCLPTKYKTCRPRPIPQSLATLLDATAKATNTSYNFALVNYYASGQDSISFHSDDEIFLEKEPAIASFSFLGTRDFLLKHKPVKRAGEEDGQGKKSEEDKPMKFNLTGGTLILMR
jgi:hypothetical protein